MQLKYTPLREVLGGKRVLLIEDTIVRSTTLKVAAAHLRERGGATEIHVRVACPPIVAPCFYGIDMSTVRELFAPRFMKGTRPTDAEQDAMAAELGADSLLLSAAGSRGPLHRPGRTAMPGLSHRAVPHADGRAVVSGGPARSYQSRDEQPHLPKRPLRSSPSPPRNRTLSSITI